MAERQPIVGGDSGVWGTILNAYLSVALNADGTLRVVPLSAGGTGTNFASALALAAGLNLALWKPGADIVAAATVPLPNPLDGNYIKITGNTGITALSTTGVAVGTVLRLEFTGTPVLTHGASFFLQGAANYTVVAGNVLTFVLQTGGVWKEIPCRIVGGGTTSTFWRGDGTWQTTPAATLATGITGLTLSNSGGDPTNDINVAVGSTISDDSDPTNKTSMYLASSIIKQLDVNWVVGTNQGGLDTGVIGNNTYHVFLIKRPDTGVVDVLFSLSVASPTMPTNYTKKQRIGSIVRTAGAIKGFKQVEDRFDWVDSILDVNNAASGTAANTATLTVPTGIVVIACINTTHTSGGNSLYWSSLDVTDAAPSITVAPLGTVFATSGTANPGVLAQVRTNTSAQARYRATINGQVYAATLGWIDLLRGKN